jgi:hypothetical protein
MYTFCKFFLVVLICTTGMVPEAKAQKKRAEKTSSARAAYGVPPSKSQYKQKKTKMPKAQRSQSSRKGRAEARNKRKHIIG